MAATLVISCLCTCTFICIVCSRMMTGDYNRRPRQGFVGSHHDPSFGRPRNIFGGYGGHQYGSHHDPFFGRPTNSFGGYGGRHYSGSSHSTVGHGGRDCDSGGGVGSGGGACDSGAGGFESGGGAGSGGRACDSGAGGSDSGGGVCDSGGGGGGRD
ncbi:unnamed protein product [Ixodes persulcatus]